MLGDDIEVVVVDIRGDKVRLGFTTPRGISLHRKEVWEQIRRERAAEAERTRDTAESRGRPDKGYTEDDLGDSARRALGESPPAKMFVISRSRDQVVMLGDDMEVVVVDIRGDKVRLGLTAPKEISVHRKEVYEQIKAESAAATSLGASDLPQSSSTRKRGQTETAPQRTRPHTGEESSTRDVRPPARPVFSIWIDPGDAGVQDVVEVLDSIAQLHRACGGYGLTLEESGTELYSVEVAGP